MRNPLPYIACIVLSALLSKGQAPSPSCFSESLIINIKTSNHYRPLVLSPAPGGIHINGYLTEQPYPFLIRGFASYCGVTTTTGEKILYAFAMPFCMFFPYLSPDYRLSWRDPVREYAIFRMLMAAEACGSCF